MDWEIDEDRSTPIAHVLAPSRRKYMLEGDTGDLSRYQVENMQDRIREKEAKLPTRFQDLIDDITLFHRYGVLNNSSWTDSAGSEIEELCSISPRISEFRGLSRPVVEPVLPARFGFELGCALRLLFEATDETEQYQRVLWGLLLSDVLNHSEEFQEQTRYLEDLLSEFRELNDERLAKEKEIKKIDNAVRRTNRSNRRTAEIIAREVWLEAGLDPTDERITTFIRATYPGGPPTNSQEDHKDEFEQILEENQPEIKFVSELEADIHEDAGFVISRNISGVSTEALLRILLKSHYVERIRDKGPLKDVEAPTESHPIFDQADKLDTLEEPLPITEIKKVSDTAQQHVTKALRQLKDKHLNPEWPQHKLVEGSKASAEWQLTGYGRVLAMYLFITGKESKWMYEAVFDNVQLDVERRRKRLAINDALNEIRGDPDELDKHYVSRRFDEGDWVQVNIPEDPDRDKAKYHSSQGNVIGILADDVSKVTDDEWFARLYLVRLEDGNVVSFAPRDLVRPDYQS